MMRGAMPPRKTSGVDQYRAVMGELRQGTLRPIYFLSGEERLLVDRVLRSVRKVALAGELADFNHDVLTPTAGPAGVLQAARTVPMMGSRRLVEVREAEGFKAADLERLIPYVQDPVESTVLVFVAGKVDTRFKFFRTLDGAGYLFRFDAVKGATLRRFLDAEAKRLGARLGPGVADLLVDLVGNDLLALSGAVEKLTLFVGEGGTVGTEHVEAVISRTRQAVIFELTDAVGAGDAPRALGSLQSLLQDGEPEVRILFMIARQIRQIWLAREALDRGTPPGGLASVLGVPPFVARKVADQARRFDVGRLEQVHGELYRTDRQLKSMRGSRALALERLILGLCQG